MADSRALRIALRNVLLGTPLAGIPLVRKPRQLVDYSTESLFHYRAFTTTRGLVERSPWQVLKSESSEPIVLGNLAESSLQGTWFHQIGSRAIDIVNLCMLCRLVKPTTVFEIGTFTGYTTLHLALNSPPDARVFTLDLPPGNMTSELPTSSMDESIKSAAGALPAHCFDGMPVADRITCLYGDSATFDFSPYAKNVDLFFIDGAHSYDYVRADTLHALECCRPGAVIAWHDFGRVGINGVSRWLIEFSRRQPVYVVPAGSLAFTVVL